MISEHSGLKLWESPLRLCCCDWFWVFTATSPLCGEFVLCYFWLLPMCA